MPFDWDYTGSREAARSGEGVDGLRHALWVAVKVIGFIERLEERAVIRMGE